MASRIIAGNASNGGLQNTGATDGILEIRSGTAAGGTVAMTIDANQNVTFANAITLTNVNYARQVLSNGSGSSTIVWDCNLGSVALIVMNGNKTLATPTNLNHGSYLLEVSMPATAYTITWPALVKWPYGVAPDLTLINSVTIISFISDGATMWGSYTPGYQ